ncbi:MULTISPECIES: hypothetical protein [unclassified Shewanella]|uniref:hypothetical protein n=1 Tax=unclassified Shewanella TaxID=196818 RepID=UPI0021D89634|nr:MULTISPECIES: hypothetical protein [unclassified Shewanella]MCU8062401.1 hypothetical protein [Shewanella sp. SM55]MCU8070968.1 hypothetical protein [Shewanella sp. SM32]MCU8089162.1 hypothetical protein [Shewanella sp. SM21]
MDKKAKKILFSTYWKNGWIDSKDRLLSDGDFEYAKSQGLMFDPISISHDDCIDTIAKVVKIISRAQIAKGFLSSLTTRRLDLRSSLSSYSIAKNIPEHKYTPVISGTSYSDGKPTSHSYTCGVCRDCKYGIRGSHNYNNTDINVLNFERIKWGGVRHGDILYTYFDLNQFINTDIPDPTDEDLNCFKEILNTIESSEPTDYPSALEKRLAKVVKSSKAERQVLIEILASIGVLRPRSYNRPSKGKNDWVFAEYWRGEDKYCHKTVDEYFGKYLQL